MTQSICNAILLNVSLCWGIFRVIGNNTDTLQPLGSTGFLKINIWSFAIKSRLFQSWPIFNLF